MRKITIWLLGVFMLASAGKVLALTPLPSCVSDRDCGSGYRCVYSSTTNVGTCTKISYVTAVPTRVPSLAPECKNLWWFDNNSKVCGLKKFCGTYMYEGLRTFVTSLECQNNLPTNNCLMKKCGDANCDGAINIQDLLVWMRERRGAGKTADFNKDGKVDIKDYDILRSGMMNRCKVVTPTLSPGGCNLTSIKPSTECGVNNNGEKSYRYIEYRCGQGELQNMGGPTSCKTYGVWKSYATNACKENCSITIPTKVPTRVPTPVVSKIVNWTTDWANFVASDYRVQVSDGTSSGRIFGVSPSKPCNSLTGEMVCVHSNPPGLNSNGLHYMTLEVMWFENDIEMRMFIYLYSDGKRWWSDEIRVYNGQAQPNTDWVYFYGRFFDTPVGQSFNQSIKFSLTAADPRNGNTPVTLSFSSVRFEAFKNYFNQITRTPTGAPTPLIAPLIQAISVPTADSNGILTLRLGEKFSVTGILKNLPGVLDKDYTRAFFFGPMFDGACSNTEWTLSCVAKKTGEDKIYVEVYKDNRTYRSNIIGVRVLSGEVTAVPVRFCNTNDDCLGGETCYQPPMPKCPEGTACVQVLPNKYCKVISTATTLPSQGVTKIPTPYACQYTGDADGDGRATIKDFGIWKSEFMSGKINKADFDCNRIVNLADYTVWKNAFLRAKKLIITPGI